MRTFHTAVLAATLACSTAAVLAQNLTGTVIADDTGSPLAAAEVVAIQRTSSLSQRPAIVTSRVDASGRYVITAPPGQYLLCVSHAGLYLDPCRWGGAKTVSVTGATAQSVALRLQKGWRFLLRVHDSGRLLAQAGTLPGDGISVLLTAPGRGAFPLPVVYDSGRVRDWGAVVPVNLPMSVTVNSSKLRLRHQSGAAPDPQGIPFQILPSDIPDEASVAASHGFHFRPPDAKIIHLYAAGLN
jgi:hypothetical protein